MHFKLTDSPLLDQRYKNPMYFVQHCNFATVEEGGRRRSQEFTELRLKFTEQGGKNMLSDRSAAKFDVNLPTERSTSTLGRGAVRKLYPNFSTKCGGAGRHAIGQNIGQ